MNFFKDNGRPELKELPDQTDEEIKADEIIDGWHFKYHGELGLRDFLAQEMGWKSMEAFAYLYRKGFYRGT